MGWIKLAGKTLEYTGKLAQADGFEEWAEGTGKGVVEKLASEFGFKLFGKTRAAKNALLSDLRLAGQSAALGSSVGKVADSYLTWLGCLGDSSLLPDEGSWKNKVRALPCFYLDDCALKTISSYLSNSAELTRLKGGSEFKEYFFLELANELRNAVHAMEPNTRRMIHCDKSINLVGIDRAYPWLPGKQPGHYFLSLDDPKGKDFDRKKIEENLSNLSAKLGTWSDQAKEDALSYCDRSIQSTKLTI